MQHFFDLKESGLLDQKTVNVMKEARCGVPDVENFSFYPGRNKWKSNTITYRSGTVTFYWFYGFTVLSSKFMSTSSKKNGLHIKFVLVF